MAWAAILGMLEGDTWEEICVQYNRLQYCTSRFCLTFVSFACVSCITLLCSRSVCTEINLKIKSLIRHTGDSGVRECTY